MTILKNLLKILFMAIYSLALAYVGRSLMNTDLNVQSFTYFAVLLTTLAMGMQAQVNPLKAIKADLPQSVERRKKWQKLYSIIKPRRVQKDSWGMIIAFLIEHYPDMPHDEKTLRKVLKYGDAGLLDDLPE